jgi:hypothetical protein
MIFGWRGGRSETGMPTAVIFFYFGFGWEKTEALLTETPLLKYCESGRSGSSSSADEKPTTMPSPAPKDKSFAITRIHSSVADHNVTNKTLRALSVLKSEDAYLCEIAAEPSRLQGSFRGPRRPHRQSRISNAGDMKKVSARSSPTCIIQIWGSSAQARAQTQAQAQA